MSIPSRKNAYDLTHQQGDVVEYITEIAQELAQMAERAGCVTLGRDLREALMRAHGVSENTPYEGKIPPGLEGQSN